MSEATCGNPMARTGMSLRSSGLRHYGCEPAAPWWRRPRRPARAPRNPNRRATVLSWIRFSDAAVGRWLGGGGLVTTGASLSRRFVSFFRVFYWDRRFTLANKDAVP